MPVKFIEVDSIITPDVWQINGQPSPYQDFLKLYIDNELVSGSPFPGRAAPDPFQWDDQTKLWKQVFGWVAPGEYDWECWNSPKHGKALMVNYMGPVPTRFPDMSNGGQWFAKDVEVHTGFKSTWAGSRACITVAPVVEAVWWANFDFRETGKIRVIDASQPIEMPAVEVKA